MATVAEHYGKVLSDVYSWMLGGFENAIHRNVEFFQKHELAPKGSGIAIDLGAGCGFQSIPLAQAGYSVTAIDLDSNLLNELRDNRGDLSINIVQDDLANFDKAAPSCSELIVCMTDTIVHLESKDKVKSVFSKVESNLESGGKFVLTFRDLTCELKELDRILPVKNDENIIMTCFLEYEPETVKVHDIVYKKVIGRWELFKSYYRKLRLSEKWVKDELSNYKFKKIESSVEQNGFITIIAIKE
jgi:precorrin-6B methylase 2